MTGMIPGPFHSVALLFDVPRMTGMILYRSIQGTSRSDVPRMTGMILALLMLLPGNSDVPRMTGMIL